MAGGASDAASGNRPPIVADEVLFSTDHIEADLRDEVWREVTRPYFTTTRGIEDGDTGLEGSIQSRSLGTLLIGPTTFNRQHYERDRRIVLRSGLDQYLLQLFVSGALQGDCDGHTVSVDPGDICVFDLAHTFNSSVRTGSTISIVLPRERVDKAAGGRSLHGVVLKAGSPITRLLTDLIVGLSDASVDMEHADGLAIADAAIDLLATGLARQLPQGTIGDEALTHVLRRRVVHFIDANLSEPELGPPLLMRRFRVSRAHLYRMFAADGGVAKVVRERRLDASYRELVRPDTPSRSITEIAYRLGFSGSAQFLRAFRARFGMTPSEARREAAQPAMADQRLEHVQARFAEYVHQLGAVDRIG